MDKTLFTVGHGTQSAEEFSELLRSASVTDVVDVRTLPGSTKFPHFNEENMREWLPLSGITYSREPGLGGLRKKTPGIDPATNGFWQNASFHRYADYALGDEFDDALLRLFKTAKHKNVAIMCAESVWWRCHRRIIADYALAHGLKAQHIMPGGRINEARLTPGAAVEKMADGVRVFYPAVN